MTLRRATRRIAIVTHGSEAGGGVPTVASWLRDALRSTGDYTVDMHDLATARDDPRSRRLAVPRSWCRRSLYQEPDPETSVHRWGANATELEVMRYRPRRELSAVLRKYDLIQVVSGTPAWAAAVHAVGVPVALQFATLVAWERESATPASGSLMRGWHGAMTRATTRIEASAIRRAGALLVENSVMLRHVATVGRPDAVKAAPGVDTAYFTPAPGGWQRTGYLLSVSRLGDPRKGLDRMIHVYANLACAYNGTPPLVLAGRGTLSSSVMRLIAERGLQSRVIVRSDVAPGDLVRLYQGAAVFLQTSHEEGLGMSVLEAMACGIPVVATRTHGTAETVVDDVTGSLVSQDEATRRPQVVAGRIRTLLEGDGALFGMRGRHRCEREFSSPVALRRFTGSYDALLRAERPAALTIA